MPKPVFNSRITYNNVFGVVNQQATFISQPVTATSSPTFGNLHLTGDATVNGNLYVNGNATILNSNLIELADNIIVINNLESGPGVTLNQAGLEIDRGTFTNYRIVYSESSGTLMSGLLNNLQPVVNRESSPLSQGVMTWDNTNKRINSSNVISIPITFNSSVNSLSSTTGSLVIQGGLGVTQDLFIAGKIYSDNSLLSLESNTSINGNLTIPVNKSVSFGTTSNSISSDTQGNLILNNFSSGSVQISTKIALGNSFISHDTSSNIIISSGNNIVLNPSNSVLLQTGKKIEFANSFIYNTNGNLVVNSSSGNIILESPIVVSLINVATSGATISGNTNGTLSLNGSTLQINNDIPLNFGTNGNRIINTQGNLVIGNSINKVSIVAGDGTNSNPTLELVQSQNSLNAIALIQLTSVFDTTVGYSLGRGITTLNSGRDLTVNLPSYPVYNNTGSRSRFSVVSNNAINELFSVESDTGAVISNGKYTGISSDVSAFKITDALSNQVLNLDTINKRLTVNSELHIQTNNTSALNISTTSGNSLFNVNTLNSTVSINSTQNSIDISSGSLIIRGGVAIQKTLNVGNGINMNSMQITNVLNPTLPQDAATKSYVDTAIAGGLGFTNTSTVFVGTFNGANNVSVASPIVGLVFASLTFVSFSIQIAVNINYNSTTLNTQYTIEGIQLSSGWVISVSDIGDTTGITFSINSTTGQLLYTTPNYTSFTSLYFTYQATGINKSAGQDTLTTYGNYYITGNLVQTIVVLDSVNVATVTNGNLSTAFVAGNVIDGYTLLLGDRILIKNQTTGTENGIYNITNSTPTRTSDFPNGGNASGNYTLVLNGNANKYIGYICNSVPPNSITGTDSITFTQYTATPSDVISAGPGLLLTGNELSVVVDSSLEITNGSLRISSSALGTGLTGGSGLPISVSSDLSFVTKLGTITTGSWNASKISVLYGGTGQSFFTSGNLLIGNGNSDITTNSGLFYGNGNLGVGTNLPSKNIHLIGNASESTTTVMIEVNSLNAVAKPQLQLSYDSQTKNAFVAMSRAADDYAIGTYPDALVISNNQTDSTSKIQFATNQYTRMTILQNGNIGINNTNPAYNLDVTGTFNVSGASTFTSISASSLEISGSTNLNNLNAIKITTGSLLLGGISIDSNTVGNYIKLSNQLNFTFNNTTNSLLTINSSGVLINNANLGNVFTIGEFQLNATVGNLNLIDTFTNGNFNIYTKSVFENTVQLNSGSSISFTNTTATNVKVNTNSVGSLIISSTSGNLNFNLPTNFNGSSGGTILFSPNDQTMTFNAINSTFNAPVTFSGNSQKHSITNTSGNQVWYYLGQLNNLSDLGYTEIDFSNGVSSSALGSLSGLKVIASISGTTANISHQHYGTLNYQSTFKPIVSVYTDTLNDFQLFVQFPANSTTNINVMSELNNAFTYNIEGTSTTPSGTFSGYTGSWVNIYSTNTISSLDYSFGKVIIQDTLDIADNLPVIGYNNTTTTSSRDLGIMFQRFQNANDSGTGDVVLDSAVLSNVLDNDQSGVPINQIKFSDSTSAVDNYYTGYWIKINSGANINQTRQIISYNGAQRTATLGSPFTTQNPTLGDIVLFYNNSFVVNYYDEANDTFSLGYTTNTSSNTISVNTNANLRLGKLYSTDQTSSINGSTGSIYTVGGVAIACTSDAVSSTNGGSFTTLGGAGINKNLMVGQSIGIGSTQFIPQESLHIKSDSGNSGLRLENNTSGYSYIDFVENSSNFRYGMLVDSSNKLFALTSSTSGSNPFSSFKALTINSSGNVGINCSSNVNSVLAIKTNGFISTNSSSGFLGLIGGNSNTNNNLVASRIILNSNSTNSGSLELRAGTSGNVSVYTSEIEQMRIGSSVSVFSTISSTNSTTGALIVNGGLSISSTVNSSSSTNGGAITVAGGVAITKDTFIGGNLVVNGTFSALGVSTTPTITFQNPVNCSLNTYFNNNLLSIGTNGVLTFAMILLPTASSQNCQIEFVLPGRSTNLSNRFDVIISVSGYTDDTNVNTLFNVIGTGITGTTNGLIKFQSSSTNTHYIQVQVTYQLN